MNEPSFPLVLLSYLPLVPAALLCCFPMVHRLACSRRRLALRMALLFLLSFPVCALLDWRFRLPPNTLLPPLLVLFYFVYHRSLRVHPSKSLAVFLYVCALASLLSNMAFGAEALRHPELGADDYTVEGALIQLGFLLAAVLVFLPLTRYTAWLIDRLDLNRVWYTTLPVSCLIAGVNQMLRPLHYETLYVNRVFLAFWTILLTLFLLFCMLSVIFYGMVKWILAAAETETRSRLLEMQESQYVSQQNYMEATAAARHDFKQSIRTLKALSRAGDYDAIDAYLAQYPDTLPENDVILYCRNRAVNALLNYYTREAQDSGIDLNLEIDLPDRISVTDVDLCTAAGNILDNAVAACRELPRGERWLQFSLTARDDRRLYLVATNSFSGRVRQRDGRYLSTRRGGDGIGLGSVRSIAERYGGFARFSHEDRAFYSDVMFPLAPPERADP